MDTEVLVTVSESDADVDRLEALTLALREELLALDVEDVYGVSEGSAPPGTRGRDLAAVGALVVTVKTSTELVDRLITAVRGWLAPGSAGREVEVIIGNKRLKLRHATREQQEQLVEHFLGSLENRSTGE